MKKIKELQGIPPQKTGTIEWVIMKKRGDVLGSKIPVGLAALVDFHPLHLRAEFLIGILEDVEKNRGIGPEAALLIMDFAFNQAYLKKLVAFIYEYNQIARKNIVHLGFIEEGILRKHIFNIHSGKFIDLYQYGLIQESFRENKNIARLSKRLVGRDITIAPKPSLSAKLINKERLKRIEKELSHSNQAPCIS